MSSWQQKEIAKAILAKEVGYIRKPHTDRLRVALAFPNTYYVGMSNLGFQTVYQLFNDHDDVVCERIFLPPKQQLKEQLASKTPLVTIESQSLTRSLREEAGRGAILRSLAPKRGFYIPSFYDVDYNADGTIAGWKTKEGTG